MPSLPTVGGDTGAWGTKLNDYLQVAHNSDGTQIFTPLNIPGLVAWWDASDSATITQSSGLVSQWNDKGGFGYNLTASTTARPTTGTRTINSLNVLDFNGSSNVMNIASGFGQVPYSIYVVIEPDTISGTDLIVHGGSTGVSDWSFFLNAGTPTFFSSSASATSSALSAGTAYLLRNRITSVGGWNSMRAGGINGTSILTTTSPYTNLEIGNTNTGSNFFDGKLGEIIFVGSPIGAGFDNLVRTYLASKWGVTA